MLYLKKILIFRNKNSSPPFADIAEGKGRFNVFKKNMKNLSGADWLALILLIVGGLNWGLVGLFNLDLVALVFGPMSMLSRIVYSLVGVSAIYMLFGTKGLMRK